MKPDEPLYDPILAEIYRTRDAYAREFNFDVDAICEALERRKPRAAGEGAHEKEQAAKPKSRLARTRRSAA